jgi:hypothetical protein
MVEASLSLQQSQGQAQLRASMSRAAITLAHREAEKAVKRGLAAQGIKPQLIAKREIVAMAQAYLAQHPELIDEARPVIEQWAAEGFFGKRAARNLRLLCKSESPTNRALPLNETHAHKGAQ